MLENTGLINRGKYRRAKLKQYSDKMSKYDGTHLWNDTVARILEEQGYEIKEDPRSIYDPQQMWDSLERYSPLNDTYIDQKDEHFINGFNMAFKVFAKPADDNFLEVLRTSDQLVGALKGEKFAGLPTLGKKRDDLIYGIDREKQVLLGIKAPAPCLAGKRCQRGNKTRLVWMYPMEMTIMEARFARPLIDRFLDRRTTMAFGMKSFQIGAIVDSISFHDGKKPVAIDYSKYDSSVPSFLIKKAFQIIGTWYSDDEKREFGFDTILKYFLTTPIVMIDGNLYTGKRHGIPSGSYFTQLVGSIVNTILIGALSSKFKLGIQWEKFLVLGDDVIVGLSDPNLEEMAVYLKTFGIKLNVEKTKFKAHFLGADWEFGKPNRNFSELLSMAVQPESFKHMGKTESERRTAAFTLLTNYACTYRNGFKFLNKRFHSPQFMNHYEYEPRVDLMTGSDRFITEYGRQLDTRGESRVLMVRRFLK